MEMGQRSGAGERGCEASSSRAELVGLVLVLPACCLWLRRGGETPFGLSEWKASLPFCLHFFLNHYLFIYLFSYLHASFSRSCHFT